MLKRLTSVFRSVGFEVEFISYFYGCATGIKGKKIEMKSELDIILKSLLKEKNHLQAPMRGEPLKMKCHK